MNARLRRLQLEARVLARELAEVMSAGVASAVAPLAGRRRSAPPSYYDRVHPDRLLGEMGINVHGD